MASGLAYDFVYNLQRIGVYDVVLPMILVFAIMYSILQKIKIFGKSDKAKGTNLVVSIVFSLLILLPEYGIVDRINVYLPRFAFIIVIVVSGMILLGLLGADVENGLSKWMFGLFLILSLAGLIIVNSDFLPQSSSLRYFWADNAWTIGTIAAVVVVIGMIVGFGSDKEAAGGRWNDFRGPQRSDGE